MLSSKIKPIFLILQTNACGDVKEFNDLYYNTPKTIYKTCWGVFNSNNVSLKKNAFKIGDNELPIQVVNRCYTSILNIIK